MNLLPHAQIAANPLLATLLIALMGAVAASLAASVRLIVSTSGCSKSIPFMCLMLSLYVAATCNQLAHELDVERAIFLLTVFLMMNMVLVELCKRRRSY